MTSYLYTFSSDIQKNHQIKPNINNKNPQLNWDQLYGAKKWIQASENSINEYLNNKNEYQIRYGFTYSNMNVKVSGY